MIAAFQKEAEIRRVEPGEVIIAEGDRIGLDEDGDFRGDFYIIHLGFVKVSKTVDGHERVIRHLSKGDHFGEIALLPDHPAVANARDELGMNPYQRTRELYRVGRCGNCAASRSGVSPLLPL